MSETDFLSFLVDETLRLQKAGKGALSSFELKLNDYGLSFLKGEFIPQTQLLRFKTTFGVLDVPINWSFFSNSADHIIDNQNDNEYLLKIFKHYWIAQIDKLLITHADGFCYIVGIKEGEEFCLHDLLNPQELLKAA
jgi:hypothetical protein